VIVAVVLHFFVLLCPASVAGYVAFARLLPGVAGRAAPAPERLLHDLIARHGARPVSVRSMAKKIALAIRMARKPVIEVGGITYRMRN
jgi:TPP-dependent trihydroxycyclohexane-1,2-dione (THcHDO) dehydratase